MIKIFLLTLIFIGSVFANEWNPSLQLKEIRDCERWSSKAYEPVYTKSVWKRADMKFYDFSKSCRCLVLEYADANSISLNKYKKAYKFLKESRKFDKNEFKLIDFLKDEDAASSYVAKTHTFNQSLYSFQAENQSFLASFIAGWKTCLSNNTVKGGTTYRRTLTKRKQGFF